MGDYAKKKLMRPLQQLRPDVAEERAAFAEQQPSLEAEKLVFIDEAGALQGMRLAYGYAPSGLRCIENAPFRTGRRRSLIGFMSAAGGEIVHFVGSVTAPVFERFVGEYVVPHLRQGDTVIWDNARTHSAKAVALIEAAGAQVLALPRYSPEYNAIELLWSKLKHYLRRLRADTEEALTAALVEAASWLTEEDARAWISHCGYTFQAG